MMVGEVDGGMLAYDNDVSLPEEPAGAAGVGELVNVEPRGGKPPRAPIPWRNHLRCLFLTAIVAGLTLLVWQPGLGKLSLLISLATPAHGDNLAWYPEATPIPGMGTETRRSVTPEWRLTATADPAGEILRSAPLAFAPDSRKIPAREWGRYSVNPWTWTDDVGRIVVASAKTDAPGEMPLPGPRPLVPPASQPQSAIANAVIGGWTPSTVPAAPTLSGIPFPALPEKPADTAELSGQSLQDISLPPLPSLPAVSEIESNGAPSLSLIEAVSPAVSAVPSLPEAPVAIAAPETREIPESKPVVAAVQAKSEPVVAAPVLPDTISAPVAVVPETKPIEQPAVVPVQTVPAKPPETGLSVAERVETSASPAMTVEKPAEPARMEPAQTIAAAPEEKSEAPAIDWKNREITGEIPGAYLMVYPSLKFVGLCVPGQGYIRKYYQVGVPRELTKPKRTADDGSCPYGRYYIAEKYRDTDGPRLFLSWPSPDDAVRIGLPEDRRIEVDSAWKRMALPPQDTRAGGGVAITGLRRWVEKTDGGFSLEEPQMEELFLALPEKAWVYIERR